MKIKVSLAQLNLIYGDQEKNLEKALSMIRQAAMIGSDLILLPELWSSGYDLENRDRYAAGNIAILQEIHRVAELHSIWVGGSMITARGKEFFNTFSLFRSKNDPQIFYDKTHLFRLMDEEKWFSAGTTPCLTEQLPWGKSGLATCYDLRFPELFRHYAVNGAGITFLVSQWAIQRVEHWRTLLRARAIENQMFIAAVNSTGKIGPSEFGGRSAIIDPWGEVLIEGSQDSEELLSADLDLDLVSRVRERIPVFQDRRTDIYG